MQNLFSYPLIVDELSGAVKKYHLIADERQRAYIAEVLKVNGVNEFEAFINVKSYKKEHLLKVWGKARAELLRTSVISLDEFSKIYEPEFELTFDTKLTPQDIKEMDFDFEDEVPDLVEDGKIDLAAIAMEQIALEMEDFPRKEGEVFNFKSEFDEETTHKANPFAALASLKK